MNGLGWKYTGVQKKKDYKVYLISEQSWLAGHLDAFLYWEDGQTLEQAP